MEGKKTVETYTVKEVAEMFGVGLTTTYEAVKRGEIPSINVRGRIVIPKKRFDRWLASGVDE